MRVIVLGEDAVGGLMHSYVAGFQELGIEATGVCLRRLYAESMPFAEKRALRRMLRPAAVRRFNGRLLAALEGMQADLVLVLKGQNIAPETVDAMRSLLRAPIVNYYPDDPFSPVRSNRPAYGLSVLGRYDRCYTFARHLMPAYRSVGARDVGYLPFARDPSMHAPVRTAAAVEYDLIFVGNLDAERVRWLEPLADLRLGIYGEHTRAALPVGSPLHKVDFHPAMYARDLAETVARGHIALNVMRHQNRLSHNMRSFELPACGVFTLSQRTPELTELFREGEEIACFGSPEELLSQVKYWLAEPARRARIAEAGFHRVEHDTYGTRAATILEEMGATVAERA